MCLGLSGGQEFIPGPIYGKKTRVFLNAAAKTSKDFSPSFFFLKENLDVVEIARKGI